MFKIFLTTLVLTVFTFADGPVLKTGQTTSYDTDGNVVTDGSVKDDGYYQAGVARRYGRSAAGVVTDHTTGLEWQDDVVSVQRKWEDSGSYPAAEYCDTLPLGGHNDWRLPSIHELLTLVDASQNSPSTTEGIFSHITLYDYWSSTASMNFTYYARVVDFGGGFSYYGNKNYSTNVRCVRSGQLEPSHFSRNDETDIVTDTMTGLQWQDDDTAITTDANWTAAINYCEDTLTLGGYSDWRLPNRNELLSTVDYSQYDLYIYPVFANRSSYDYWSSTSSADGASRTWLVGFYNGDSGTHGKTYDHYVRCVRGGQINNSASLPPVIMYLLD